MFAMILLNNHDTDACSMKKHVVLEITSVFFKTIENEGVQLWIAFQFWCPCLFLAIFNALVSRTSSFSDANAAPFVIFMTVSHPRFLHDRVPPSSSSSANASPRHLHDSVSPSSPS